MPLAVFLGYLLSDPLDSGSFVTVTVVLAVLCAPLLIRFHYPLMLLSWNMGAILFFLPGRPQLFFATIAISFGISFSQRILNKEVHAINVPQLIWPILAIGLVVAVTAMLTGGFGVRALGGGVYGGKRYFLIFLAIVGYFALTAHRIPHERANRYVALFFLGGLTYVIGDLFPILGQSFQFLFWVFTPSNLEEDFALGITRLGGVGLASAGIFAYMMAKYGVRGIFNVGKPWRAIAFVSFSALSLLGGFRSVLISLCGIFALQFFLEGLHRTKLVLPMVLALTITSAVALPFASKLPFTVQRALAFLPLPIDAVARRSAEESSDWRLRMWKAVLPQVPQHLLLGKGLAMSQEDFGLAAEHVLTDARALTEDQWGAALAGDYHNGPLSVVIPFGIWGVIAWVWFSAAGLWVLYRNYRYGDPALKSVNTFLLASVVIRMLMFWFIVGGFYQDILYYVGVVGLNVSLNGGVTPRVTAQATSDSQINRLPTVMRRQRPVFSR